MLGEIPVEVSYLQQCNTSSLVVVAGNGPSLLGQNWLKHIRLDWKTIGAIANEEVSLDTLLNKHKDLFKDALGTIHPFQVTLQVRPEAQPKYFKPRSTPYAAIEQELDRLEASGAIEKIPHSDWAAPIVPVPKKDGKFRICSDYKVTINQALDVDQYPLPKLEDLFLLRRWLVGRNSPSLIYLKPTSTGTLDTKSSKYVTVNTHHRLYRYHRLPFGVASAPAIFQKVMDTVLLGNPSCDLLHRRHSHHTAQGWPSQVADSLQPFKTQSQELTVGGGCVLWGFRVIIPKKLQAKFLQELHRYHPGTSSGM